MLMMLRYLGKDGDTTNVADYDAVVEMFKSVRQYIKTFDNTNYLNAIPNKELCVINNWSGDYATAKARASRGRRRDQSRLSCVRRPARPPGLIACAFPADAKNKENAYKFLEYMLQPEVIAKCTNFTNYANGNAGFQEVRRPGSACQPGRLSRRGDYQAAVGAKALQRRTGPGHDQGLADDQVGLSHGDRGSSPSSGSRA